MAFSADIKEEILKEDCRNPECSLAFIAGIAAFTWEPADGKLRFITDGEAVAKKLAYLCRRRFGITDAVLTQAKVGRGGKCWSVTYEKDSAEKILSALSEKNRLGGERFETDMTRFTETEALRCYVMGAYLGGGFMIEPEKLYHMEFAAKRDRAIEELTYALIPFGEVPKCVRRGNYKVMYFKSFESLDNLLAIIGAHKCMMALTNLKIEKEQKNELNRRNNFEVANMQKTVNASQTILHDIESIMYTVGLEALPEELQQMALLRWANEDASLSQLAGLSGLSRSGVNHRLKKISEIARGLE